MPQKKASPWTDVELGQLKALLIAGLSYYAIADIIPGRNKQQCQIAAIQNGFGHLCKSATKRWAPGEIKTLRGILMNGGSATDAARVLENRTLCAVKHYVKKHGLTPAAGEPSKRELQRLCYEARKVGGELADIAAIYKISEGTVLRYVDAYALFLKNGLTAAADIAPVNSEIPFQIRDWAKDGLLPAQIFHMCARSSDSNLRNLTRFDVDQLFKQCRKPARAEFDVRSLRKAS